MRASLGALALDVELDVPAGRRLALVGPSGAGKTSVLRAVAGLLDGARGTVVCGGETWLDSAAGVRLPPERRSIGLVFQDYALFPHMSALANVAYGAAGETRAERRARAAELLERLGLAARAAARPAALSGGERQRVALARALARRPRALLLDEPLAALDPRTRGAAARELAGELAAAGVPAIVVTHDFAEAAALADEICVLAGGRAEQRGAPADLVARPASSLVADVTGAVVLSGVARAAPGGGTLVTLDGGGELVSTDPGAGRVAAVVRPWDVEIEPAGAAHAGSARNRLEGEIASVVPLGGRVRVGIAASQPLVAEVSEASAAALGLRPGVRVAARWKAAATRLVPLER